MTLTFEEKIEREEEGRKLASGLKKGDRVRFRKSGDVLWEGGMFDYAWACLGVPCFSIRTDDGPGMEMVYSFGDEVEKVK